MRILLPMLFVMSCVNWEESAAQGAQEAECYCARSHTYRMQNPPGERVLRLDACEAGDTSTVIAEAGNGGGAIIIFGDSDGDATTVIATLVPRPYMPAIASFGCDGGQWRLHSPVTNEVWPGASY